MLSAVLQVHLFALFFAFLFICNHWGEERKTKASEDVLKGQTVQVIGLGETGLFPAAFQMRAAGFLRPSTAHFPVHTAHDVCACSESWIQ